MWVPEVSGINDEQAFQAHQVFIGIITIIESSMHISMLVRLSRSW